MRKFNITGLCVPNKHYMVDTAPKITEIAAMVDEGLYFTINRARQYGKTTTFSLLRKKLNPKYLALNISFEGVDDSAFQSNESFCKMFIKIINDELKFSDADDRVITLWKTAASLNMLELSDLITELCKTAAKPIVLMIDEVDKTTNNRVFLNFLGMLRNKYLKYNDGKDITFHSVILAGVYDVKNLKLKISGEKTLNDHGERIYNSPWNIAADFLIDMSFKPDEIATMLHAYENDFHTGMNIGQISDEIYRFTNGYPFLVSKLCKIIDERLDREWTSHGAEEAVKLLLQDNNTLFDDMFKNIESNRKLYDLIYDVVIMGTGRAFALGNPEIELGSMFGILNNRNGKVVISNLIFEILMTNYLASKTEAETGIIRRVVCSDAIEGGRLNLQMVLEKFAQHYHELYSNQNEQFLEKHGRLLFITYLRPFINGAGFYHIESETRDTQRMDLAVDYGTQQFIIELKLWHGEKKHEDAYSQLNNYLAAKNAAEGFLLTFDFRKGKRDRKAEWVEYAGRRIFDVIV